MDSFLSREVGETWLDSHGKFTVNSRLAIEKMAKFQLSDPNYWILKLIQAGVRSGATGITISLGVESSRILFTPGEEWSLAQIENDLLEPQPSPKAALYHFKQAIWNACFAQGFPFELRLPGSDRELIFQDGQLEHRPCRPGRQLRLTVQHRPPTAMSRLIYEQAYVCPIPLTVNQERVDEIASRDPCFYYETLEWPEFPLKVSSSACKPRYQFTTPTVTMEAGLPLLVSRNSSPKPSQRHWVLDGIILQSQVLEIPLNGLRGDLYISAEGLQCDATGTRLVEDQDWHTRRIKAGQAMADCIWRLKLVHTQPKRRDMAGAKKVLGGVFAVTFLLNPLIVGGAALFAFGMMKAASYATPPPPPESVTLLEAFQAYFRPNA